MNDRDAMLLFVFSEFIIGVCKQVKDSIQGFNAPIETAASAGKPRYVCSQVRVYALNIVRVFFVVYVANMPPGKY